jgi:hypothetical protein
MSETWKTLPGYEGLYEVSDAGVVIGLSKLDTVGRPRPRRALVTTTTKSGHLRVVLFRDGKKRRVGVHVLVLEAFVGPRPPGMWACHWNDLPTDNRLRNLRWATPSDNQYDSVRNNKHAMSSRTACYSGHEFTPQNTYLSPRGQRVCRECARLNQRRYRAKKRELGI